jgi:hypothetical protein
MSKIYEIQIRNTDLMSKKVLGYLIYNLITKRLKKNRSNNIREN